MSMGTLADLAKKVKGELVGGDDAFSAVSTDTRSIQKGQLFVALKGPNFDGCEFVQEAADQGAAGALVDRVVNVNITQIQVQDTKQALGEFATSWRNQFDIPVIGVTGSNGKTTIKQFLAQILSTRGPTLSTRGNLNNDIGVPLTLLDINKKHWAAVVEMGANHHGEIGYLTDLARPTVGILSNARDAHLEGFGSIQGVAEAKGELFSHMPHDSTAIINADDDYCDYWRRISGDRPIVTFGHHPDADVRFHNVSQELHGTTAKLLFDLSFAGETASVTVGFAGEHNAYNAAAAAAATLQVGMSLPEICEAISKTRPVSSRMNIRESKSGARIVDDTYNANPASLKAAVEFVTGLTGDSWLVLGDMGELGEDSAELHKKAGAMAKEAGITRLFTYGELSRHAVDGFGSGGLAFTSMDELAETVTKEMHDGLTVLVKASRAMGFEYVVSWLISGEKA